MQNWNEFVEHVLSCYPNEACGIVSKGVFIPCENTAENRVSNFRISPTHPAWFKDEVQAVLHSHTTPYPDSRIDPRTPSKADMQGQLTTVVPWGIVYCDGNTVTDAIYYGDKNNRPPLEGRSFVFNAQDCLCLAADYLYAEHGIELPVLPRDWDWFAKGEDLIGSNWKAWGFEEVALNDALPGDCVLFKTGTAFVNHIGVYLGDDKLLHHQIGRLSCIEGLSRFAKYIANLIRYKKNNESNLPR